MQTPTISASDRHLLALARAGDGDAFRELIRPYQRELEAYCYRMLASAQDAEDAAQETLLTAWHGLPEYAERASLRTWLYRIATTRCLNMLRAARRRPVTPASPHEVTQLEPYPDTRLGLWTDPAPGPEAQYEAREAISLAFVRLMQLLPSRQRATLVLRDVLGFRTQQVAEMLGTTELSVASALKRARATVAEHRSERSLPSRSVESELVEQLTRSFATGDVAGVVALLTDDVRLTMPPDEQILIGSPAAEDGIRRLFGSHQTIHLEETRANGRPAFGVYAAAGTDAHRGVGVLVVDLDGDRVCAMTWFRAPTLQLFGLPLEFSRRPGKDGTTSS